MNGNGASLTSPQDVTQPASPPASDQQAQQLAQQPAQPSTDQTSTAATPSGPAVPQFKFGDVEAEARPSSWGLRVGTADDVRGFDNYMAAGGDINKIPVSDQIGIALAKDPDFFKKNPEAFYDYVYTPLQHQQRSAGDVFNQAVMALPGQGMALLGNIKDMVLNQANRVKDGAELTFRKATGATHDQAYQDLLSRTAAESATEAQGLTRAVTTNGDLLLDVASNIIQGTKPIAKLFTQNDPQGQDQVDRAYSQLLLNKGSAQQDLQNLGKTVQSTVAQAYKLTGVYADLGEKMQTATPDQSAVTGYGTVFNPLNFVGMGEGGAVVGAARPILFERGLEAAEDLAGANAKKLALDTTQILPRNPEVSAANPAYIPVRNVQAELAPEARNAAQDVANAQDVLQSRLTTIGKIAGDPGTATSFAASALQTIGGGLQNLGENAAKVTEWPANIAGWLSGGNEVVKKVVQDATEKYLFGTLLHHLGPIGGAVEVGLEHLPDIGSSVGSLFKTMGQELSYADATVPYFTRVAMQNKNMPKWLASALDSPLVQTAVDVGRAGLTTAATGAAIGGAAGGIPGAVAGAAQGGILGMAGGGFGQWMRFRDPNQYLLAARSDWKRYTDLLSPTERQNFSQLAPTNQLILAQSMMNFPGLRVDYFRDPAGPRGMHYTDEGGASHIQVNTAAPQSALTGIFAHELIHAATHSGMVTELYDTHFGNPITGEIGQFTKLGPDGKPIGIDPVTQRYTTNQDFANLKTQYTNALAQSGVPTAHLSDFDISREIYAEHGVDYLLSGGALLDSNSAFRPGLYSQSALKTAMAKVGYTFDQNGRMLGIPNGTIGGTGLFNELQRNPTLQQFAQSYFTKDWQNGMLASEEQPTRQFTKKDLQNPNTTETWLNNAPEIMRNQDGTAKRDPNTGQPILRNQREVKAYNAGFADNLRKALEAIPEDQRMELGYQKTTTEKGENTFVRYLPEHVLDSLTALNQYNPHQIASLRMLSRVLADKGNAGMEMRFFYRTATTPNKRYGTFAGSERLAVPFGIEITGDNNVNIRSVDFAQLANNYLKVRNRAPFKGLWKDASEFTQDAHTYFTNHKEGRPGSDAIGEAKRDAINSLAGFGTEQQRLSNPLVDRMPPSVRSIVKSFAIDRANQISSTGAMRPFISEAQYYNMNRNWLPRTVVAK